ncbi:MAG: RDD family protein [Candidatus Anstonellales archaeon]
MEINYQLKHTNNNNQNLNQQQKFIAIEFFYASTIQRIIADIVDTIIIMIPLIILTILFRLDTIPNNNPVLQLLMMFINFSVFFLYGTLLEGMLFSATLGKLLMGIKVVDANGNNLNLQKAALRNLVKSFSGWFGLLSFLIDLLNLFLIAFTPKKQAVHDIIANTYVVVQIKPNQVFQRKFSSQ